MLGRSLTALEEETPSQDPPDEAGGFFEPQPRFVRDLGGLPGSAPGQIFSTRCRAPGRTSRASTRPPRFLPLVFVPGAFIPCGQLPLASLRSERGTVLLLRIVKEHVDLTVLFSTYVVNTFWYIIQNVLFSRQIAIQDTMRHIDDRFSAGVSRLVRDPVRTRPVVVRCGWWLNSPV